LAQTRFPKAVKRDGRPPAGHVEAPPPFP